MVKQDLQALEAKYLEQFARNHNQNLDDILYSLTNYSKRNNLDMGPRLCENKYHNLVQTITYIELAIKRKEKWDDEEEVDVWI